MKWLNERIKPVKHPMNESYEHWFCKNVGRLLLYRLYNCRFVGVEIAIIKRRDELLYPNGKRVKDKQISDVIGMTRQDITYSVESKVSVSDYYNGFSANCNYNYIICPKGVISPDIVPDGIGLIYVSIPEFKYYSKGLKFKFEGYELIKKASYFVDSHFLNSNGETNAYYDKEIESLFYRICNRNTIELVFNPRKIPMYR